jgi:cell division protein FtsL
VKSAYSIRRPVANAFLVRERDRKLRCDLLSVLAVALPLSAAVLAYVGISSQLWDVGYEVLRLEQTLDERLEAERRLKLEAATLARPARIEELATEELGLSPLDLDSVVFAGELE